MHGCSRSDGSVPRGEVLAHGREVKYDFHPPNLTNLGELVSQGKHDVFVLWGGVECLYILWEFQSEFLECTPQWNGK